MSQLVFFEERVLYTLSSMLIHSIWQFFIIAVVLSLVLKKMENDSGFKRYSVSIIAMGLLVFSAVLTFLWGYFKMKPLKTVYNNLVYTVDLPIETPLTNYSILENISNNFNLDPYQLVFIWIFGVLLLLIRFLGSLIYLQKIKSKSFPIEMLLQINQVFDRIKVQMGVKKKISIMGSRLVHSPVIIGYFNPIILFPVSLVNQLTTDEVTCILSHEVAHYLRKDWLVNILQSLVEIVFYYHPAVYFISKAIRTERENCCDEQAINTMNLNFIQYAKTLVKVQELESQRESVPQLSLAFSKKGNIFFHRIKRILKMNQVKSILNEKILVGLVLIVGILFFSKELSGLQNLKLTQDNNYLGNYFDFLKDQKPPLDTLPEKRESIKIFKSDGTKDIKLSMENGEIISLEVDGKVIAPEQYDDYKDLTEGMYLKSEGKDKNIRGFGNGNMFFQEFDFAPFGQSQGFQFQIDTMIKGLPFYRFEEGSEEMLSFQNKMKELQEKMGKNFQFNFEDLNGFDFQPFDENNINKSFKFYFDGNDFNKGREMDIQKLYDMEIDRPIKGKNVTEVIGNHLNKDGFLIPDKENTIELTGKYLKINGEKQPSNIWNKYKRIFEQEMGTTLDKGAKIKFSYLGKEPKRKYKMI